MATLTCPTGPSGGGLCGQRDNFVGFATNTKATSLIFNNLHFKLVATEFSGRFSANFRSAQPPQIRWHLALPARWYLVLQHPNESVHRTYEDAVAAERLDVVDEG